jgi:uncharacterized membrane protein YraQ (UPF0718 family)
LSVEASTTLNSLRESLSFFGIIMLELIVLFLVISVIVGLLREYVPDEKVRKVLSARRGLGNVLGAAFGAITPFCSCSTIPVTLGLLNAGAPFGATMAFLLASPLLNPVILGLFVVVFGWQVALSYAGITFVLVVILSAVLERFGFAEAVKRLRVKGGEHVEALPTHFRARLGRAAREAWGEFRGVLPFLVVGVAIGAAVYGFVPSEWVAQIAGPENPAAVPLAALVGIPLYVRVETLIPISLALLDKGMGLGAIMALVIGGAGASIPEVSMLMSIFKPRLVGAFLATVLSVAILAGLSFNILFV